MVSSTSTANMALTDRFEILKEIGDGSFGSVVLAKVRSAGSNVARRGSVVCLDRENFLLVTALICFPGCDQNYEEDF